MKIKRFNELKKRSQLLGAELHVLAKIFNIGETPSFMLDSFSDIKGDRIKPNIIQWRDSAVDTLKEVDSDFLDETVNSIDEINKTYIYLKKAMTDFRQKTWDHIEPISNELQEIGLEIAKLKVNLVSDNLIKFTNGRKIEINTLRLIVDSDDTYLKISGRYYNGKKRNKGFSTVLIELNESDFSV